VRVVPPEWLTLAAQIATQVNIWAKRRDLTVYIAPNGQYSKAAAAYYPVPAEIEVNSVRAFGAVTEPQDVKNFTDRDTQYDHPSATGVLFHEAMHAHHSTEEIFNRENELELGDERHWYNALEEPRIEYLGVKSHPENRDFLRACALEIVLTDVKDMKFLVTKTSTAANLAVLSWGRVDAGVLEMKDIKGQKKIIREVIPTAVLKQLRTLWREYIKLTDNEVTRMLDIAREFARIVREQTEKEKEDEPDITPEQLAAWIQALINALSGDKVASQFEAESNVFDTKLQEKAKRDEKTRMEEAADTAKNQAVAQQMFLPNDKPSNGSGRSVLVRTRPPTAEERAVATKISKALQKAKYRDRIVTKHASVEPPGKLRASTAMQGIAIKASGGSTNTAPWRQKKRHVVEDPNLTIGIMCDVSGSMQVAMEPIAVSTWALSAAAKRINADAAAVYYGRNVFPVLKPGEFLQDVNIYKAADGYEAFDMAFRSLDGGLDLLNGHGARLLVVCSDGEYKEKEPDAVIKWLNRCRQKGVAVLWLDYKGSSNARSFCAQTGATHVLVGQDVVAAAEIIGRAATDALSKASAY